MEPIKWNTLLSVDFHADQCQANWPSPIDLIYSTTATGGARRETTGGGSDFFLFIFRALTWNDGKSPVLCMHIYMHIMYIYIYTYTQYVLLKGWKHKARTARRVFFFRGWDTITINYWNLWVSEAVSSGVSPCSKRGIISSPWGIRPTEPGSCLLVSAGSGVHLLDLETKSSFGMGLGQWIISQLPNATPPN